MTVALDLPPQVQKACLAEARAKGWPLDAVVRVVLIAGQTNHMSGRTAFKQGLGLSIADGDDWFIPQMPVPNRVPRQ